MSPYAHPLLPVPPYLRHYAPAPLRPRAVTSLCRHFPALPFPCPSVLFPRRLTPMPPMPQSPITVLSLPRLCAYVPPSLCCLNSHPLRQSLASQQLGDLGILSSQRPCLGSLVALTYWQSDNLGMACWDFSMVADVGSDHDCTSKQPSILIRV